MLEFLKTHNDVAQEIAERSVVGSVIFVCEPVYICVFVGVISISGTI